MTYLEKIIELFPDTDAEIIIKQNCPYYFFGEAARTKCENDCTACWGRKIKEA